MRNRYIDKHPEEVLRILTEKTEIRKFWYEDLKYLNSRIPVLTHLLAGGYIQGNDKNEAYGRIQEFMFERNYCIGKLGPSYRDVLIDRTWIF